LRFQAPFGGLETMYDNHLRLIGKRIMDFLSVLIELFFARCYGSGVTSEYRFKIGNFAPMIFRMVEKSGRSFFCLVTIHVFDRQTGRQTDGQTTFSSLDRVCIPCSAVKRGHFGNIVNHIHKGQ